MSISGCSFFCSWSGGKDSCLALYRAVKQEGKPKFLFTMLGEDGARSRSHGIPLSVLEKQAQALGIPLVVRSATWDDYESVFVSALHQFKKDGIQAGVFGDIDIQAHREWVERVCLSAKIRAYLPLWNQARRGLLNELLDAGFKASIISLKESALAPRFLGRVINRDLIAELEKLGIDLSGEQGEYHTLVTDGPNFSVAINLEMKNRVLSSGYWFQEVSLSA